MDDDRRLCHSDCQRPDIRDPFIESATCLGIPDCLVKQVSEIVEECVLFLDIEGEDAVEETLNVILVLFAYLLNPVPNDEQSDIPQCLFGICKTLDALACNYPFVH